MAKKLLNYMFSLNVIGHIFFSLLFRLCLVGWLCIYFPYIIFFLYNAPLGQVFVKLITFFFFFWKGLLWHYNSDEVSQLQSEPNFHSIKKRKMKYHLLPLWRDLSCLFYWLPNTRNGAQCLTLWKDINIYSVGVYIHVWKICIEWLIKLMKTY